MKDFQTKKDKYFTNYANTVVTHFRKMKYGINPCCQKSDENLTFIRYELAIWQSSGDFSTISNIKRNYRIWMPKDSCATDNNTICYFNVNVNNNVAKSFHISPARTVWTLVHDLEFVPNVTTTDESGQEIMGTVVYTNATTITITFSQPVAGWAYLS
jgi:hypothetical protein